MDSEQSSFKDALKKEMQDFANDENLADLFIKLQDDDFKMQSYLLLRIELTEAKEKLNEINIAEQPYEFLKQNGVLQDKLRILKKFEAEQTHQTKSLIEIFGQFKSRLSKDIFGSFLEVTRDILSHPTPLPEKPKYPKKGRYVWRTQQDSSVRQEHLAREGLVFNYEMPPLGGNPGEAYNCRCWAEPLPESWEGGLGEIFKR